MALPVEVDHDYDTDSALGDSDISSLGTSLKSSNFYFVEENGRRYLDGRFIPNDEKEQWRLDMHHHLFKVMLNGSLHTAPLRCPMNILDIGTGTGQWALEVAQHYPAAKVIGTDISPIQPIWTLMNCSFYIDDAEENWLYDEMFDYIHGRSLSDAISDWSRFYTQVLDNLRPGAWCEIQDYHPWIASDDGTLDRSEWTKEWNERIIQGSILSGRSLDVVSLHKGRMLEAGFEDVREQIVKVPIGRWAKDPKLKDLGQSHIIHLIESVDAFTPAIYTRILGYTVDYTEKTMEGVKREFLNRHNHWYVSYYFVCGRKPGGAR